MLLPKSCLKTGEDNTTRIGSVAWVTPYVPMYVDPPSFFEELPYGNGNNVCHVKLNSISASITEGARTYHVLTGPTVTQFQSNVVGVVAPVYYADYVIQYGLSYATAYGQFVCDISVSQSKMVNNRPAATMAQDMRLVATKGTTWVKKTSSKAACFSLISEKEWVNSCLLFLDIHHLYGGRQNLTQFYSEEQLLGLIQDFMDHFPPFLYTGMPKSMSYYYFKTYDVSVGLPPALSDKLLLDESNLLIHGYPSSKPFAAYHLKAWRQEAYLDALDHIPQMNDNNISNIIGIVGFIKALVIDHRIEIPNSLSSAWLSYRYSYGTTKLDAREAIDFINRSYDFESLEKGFSCYGYCQDTYLDVPVTVRCRIDLQQRELALTGKIWSALYKYGLSPSFYAIWDMIPYSFIVDWFIPVGDILNGLDKTMTYEREYDISNIWYSIKYSYTDGDGSVTAYTRWGEASSPGFSGFYTLENKGSPSHKVIGYRILDAMSLIFK